MSYRVKVEGGKYEFVKDPIGTIHVLRYGERWHAQKDAFNAIAGIMTELDAARVVLEAARLLGDDAPLEIKRALERHSHLVGDREPPSEWCGPRPSCTKRSDT